MRAGSLVGKLITAVVIFSSMGAPGVSAQSGVQELEPTTPSAQFSFTPRFWYTVTGQQWFDPVPEKYVANNSASIMPLYGGTFTYNRDPVHNRRTRYQMTVFYSSGSGETAGAATYDVYVEGTEDIERYDLEFAAEVPFREVGPQGAFLHLGARYVDVDVDVNLTDKKRDMKYHNVELSKYYLAELGVVFTQKIGPAIGAGLNHHIDGNLTLLGGMVDYREVAFDEPYDDFGGVVGVDAAVRYSVDIGSGKIGAGYRVTALSNPGFDFNSGITVVHGPEIEVRIPLN